MIKVTEVIKIHFVIPDAAGELFDAHTHGLEALGHKEFRALVPGFWRGAAGSILNDHADRVINGGERFLPDELGEIEGAVVRYEEIPGDFLGDPTRLRIVGLPQEHGFEEGANERRSAALGRTGRPPVGVSTHSQGLQPCSKRCLLMAP